MRVLRKLGYDNVDLAADGVECVEKFQHKHYELVLMDVQMPRMDGLDATRTIRQMGGTSVPIVAMTANALKGDDQLCLEAGMTDYMAKPLDMRVLATKLNACLVGSYAKAASRELALDGRSGRL